MINGDSDFVHLQGDTVFGDSWLYYSPLLSNNWSLGIVIAHKDVVRDLNLMLIIQTLLSVVIFITISLIVYYRTLSVSSPIRLFTEIANKIGKGDFDAQLPATANSYEIERLILAFATMQKSLKEYIENLKITTTEKNRIETEVQLASEIQRKLIPKTRNILMVSKKFAALGFWNLQVILEEIYTISSLWITTTFSLL